MKMSPLLENQGVGGGRGVPSSQHHTEALTSRLSLFPRILATAGTDFDLRTLRAVRVLQAPEAGVWDFQVSLAKAIRPSLPGN